MGFLTRVFKRGVKVVNPPQKQSSKLVSDLAKNGIRQNNVPVSTTSKIGSGFPKGMSGGRQTGIKPSTAVKYGAGVGGGLTAVGVGGAAAGYTAGFGINKIRDAVAVTQEQRRSAKDNELATERVTILERINALGSDGESNLDSSGVLPYVTGGSDSKSGSPLLLVGLLAVGGIGAYAVLRKKKK